MLLQFSKNVIAAATVVVAYAGVAISSVEAQHSDVEGLQEMLLWTGDSDAVVDGKASIGTISAIRAFQKRLGSAQLDGELKPNERRELYRQGSARRDAAGFRVVDDAATGIRIGIPFSRVKQSSIQSPRAGQTSTSWDSDDKRIRIATLRFFDHRTLDQLYATLDDQSKRTIKYRRPPSGGWFVLSGENKDGSKFYFRAQAGPVEVRAFSITYEDDDVQPIVVAMSSSFVPFPSRPAPAAPAPQAAANVVTASTTVCGDVTLGGTLKGCPSPPRAKVDDAAVQVSIKSQLEAPVLAPISSRQDTPSSVSRPKIDEQKLSGKLTSGVPEAQQSGFAWRKMFVLSFDDLRDVLIK